MNLLESILCLEDNGNLEDLNLNLKTYPLAKDWLVTAHKLLVLFGASIDDYVGYKDGKGYYYQKTYKISYNPELMQQAYEIIQPFALEYGYKLEQPILANEGTKSIIRGLGSTYFKTIGIDMSQKGDVFIKLTYK